MEGCRYRCELCDYATNHKPSLTRHQNRTSPCVSNDNSNFVCPLCNKKFKNIRNLKRHEDDRCPKKKESEEEKDLQRLLTKKSKPSSVNSVVVNRVHTNNNSPIINSSINNSFNTINHNNITVYNYHLPTRSDGSQVELNSFRTPNLDYVPGEIVIQLQLEDNHLAKTIEKIYFDPKHPENHTIGQYDPSRKTCRVFTQGGFEIEKIDNITAVIIQHLKSVFHTGMTLDEIHLIIKNKLENLFNAVNNTKRPHNDFYDVRDTLTLKIEKYDAEGIDVEADPDEIPPPMDKIEHIEWKVNKIRAELTQRYEEKMKSIDDEDEIGWRGMIFRGHQGQLEKLLTDIRRASTICEAREISNQIIPLKKNIEQSLEL